MKRHLSWQLGLMASLGFCATVFGQAAQLTVVPSLGGIRPGDSVTVEIFIEDIPSPLRGYQLALVVSGGDAGSLTLQPPQSSSLFIDTARPDWVFAEAVPLGEQVAIATDASNVRLVAALFTQGFGLNPPGSTYCATFVLQASDDADGTFTVDLAPSQSGTPSSTYLAFDVGDLIPHTSVPATISVRAGCLYGDVASPYCVIDVDDILYVVDAFMSANPMALYSNADVAPCGGDGVVDVDDILATTDAYRGVFACPHPNP